MKIYALSALLMLVSCQQEARNTHISSLADLKCQVRISSEDKKNSDIFLSNSPSDNSRYEAEAEVGGHKIKVSAIIDGTDLIYHFDVFQKGGLKPYLSSLKVTKAIKQNYTHPFISSEKSKDMFSFSCKN